MTDQEFYPMPEEIKKSIEHHTLLTEITSKIKSKKHELEKAYNEISFADKDSKYAGMLYQQKARSEENYSTQLNILDEKLEAELLRISNQREEIEKRYEKQKFHLDCEEKTLRDKIALKRQKLETDAKDKQRYFEEEIQRINTEKKSNPKTRGLEMDLVALEKEKATVQIEAYGFADVCYEPYFPQSERERLLRIKKEYEEKQIVLKEQERIKKEKEQKIKEAREAEKKAEEELKREKDKERQIRVKEEEEKGGFFAVWSQKNEQMKNFSGIHNIVCDTKKRLPKVAPK